MWDSLQGPVTLSVFNNGGNGINQMLGLLKNFRYNWPSNYGSVKLAHHRDSQFEKLFIATIKYYF